MFSPRLPELENFNANGGEPPQCSITLCFGEELSTTDDLASKLVIVQVSRPAPLHPPPALALRSPLTPGPSPGRSPAPGCLCRSRCRGRSSRCRRSSPSRTPSACCVRWPVSLRWGRSRSTWCPLMLPTCAAPPEASRRLWSPNTPESVGSVQAERLRRRSERQPSQHGRFLDYCVHRSRWNRADRKSVILNKQNGSS